MTPVDIHLLYCCSRKHHSLKFHLTHRITF